MLIMFLAYWEKTLLALWGLEPASLVSVYRHARHSKARGLIVILKIMFHLYFRLIINSLLLNKNYVSLMF